MPDLTILLDLPVEAGLARKAPGDVTRFEAEFDLDFHGRVRAGFLAIAEAEPARVAVIDATRRHRHRRGGDRVGRRTIGWASRSEPEAAHVRTTR